MGENHTAVVPTLAYAEALQALADNEEASGNLRDLYADGRRDSEAIAVQHDKARTSIKRAEVNALLAIAEELRGLRETQESQARLVRLRLAEYGVTV